ncbi:murein L,D-transpeptidase catalytic domain family protein [Legionella cardiaca]|uniref:Murein L,D-transpeptidase catalytic domain family protein n=1 Tax=Legionella cardiaca TaxID=1071983 RepID=A0ABY8AV88_9GAMM|nr:murein L,D-transpeptidase catalytic domain family protein [Legionella cardiaca]WED44568.1 murein L,D-transpeptidase catalytic domain family protein [Legionella cardiaca]
MKIKLLLALAVTSTCFSLTSQKSLTDKKPTTPINEQTVAAFTAIVKNEYHYPGMTVNPLSEIREMLHKEATTLNIGVINKVLTTVKCAGEYNIEHNNILTIIDYSQPSSEKRLWVFDLNTKKLLFHTYVSHGIRSGSLVTNYFSNKHDSKASSIGVYRTENTYHGRDGLSLVLNGLDKGFNDNATSRFVVMHGGWYVDEDFIKKYGRAGRSWGCPALPLELTKPIINTIKDKSLFVIYYPNDNWFIKSKFLNCDKFSQQTDVKPDVEKAPAENDFREEILFADINKNSYREESDPIVVVTADNYERIFHTKPPVNRMLRRQINNVEYIALSEPEFRNITIRSSHGFDRTTLDDILFIIPDVQLQRGYYITQMKIVPFGKIKDVKLNSDSPNTTQTKSYTVEFETRPSINLKATNQFIRWLGL